MKAPIGAIYSRVDVRASSLRRSLVVVVVWLLGKAKDGQLLASAMGIFARFVELAKYTDANRFASYCASINLQHTS